MNQAMRTITRDVQWDATTKFHQNATTSTERTPIARVTRISFLFLGGETTPCLNQQGDEPCAVSADDLARDGGGLRSGAVTAGMYI